MKENEYYWLENMNDYIQFANAVEVRKYHHGYVYLDDGAYAPSQFPCLIKYNVGFSGENDIRFDYIYRDPSGNFPPFSIDWKPNKPVKVKAKESYVSRVNFIESEMDGIYDNFNKLMKDTLESIAALPINPHHHDIIRKLYDVHGQFKVMGSNIESLLYEYENSDL